MNGTDSDAAITDTTTKRTGGLAAWSIHHPIGVSMIALACGVIGMFSFIALSVDLLPHIIYPNIRVRILDPGVAAKIMEDDVSRQLEEQLAITEDAISVQSRTGEGISTVDLAFEYGKDIDVALRDASSRLDRAKRFLPDTIRPPIIYKLDPSQIPVYEFVVASKSRDQVGLRDWVDYVFSKWFLNLPGVASVEVGGGQEREILVLPDQHRLVRLGLSAPAVADALASANVEAAAGRVETFRREYVGRTAGRFKDLNDLALFPLQLPAGGSVHLGELAKIIYSHKLQRIRVRLDGKPGVKVSIQKQPTANTVHVADTVEERLQWLRGQGLIPGDINIEKVSDQSRYIRDALRNAGTAVIGGALLAMIVVWFFLGDLRRTLIIGTAIPFSVLVTFAFMRFGGLTLNIMTLGGLALGVGMVVDGAIVIMENIQRHQREGKAGLAAGTAAAAEVNSAIVAATSTSLAAVIPFLFVSGLVGLLFKELILTIIAAILAAMMVALTLAPSLAVRVTSIRAGRERQFVDRLLVSLQTTYPLILSSLMRRRSTQLFVLAVLIGLLLLSARVLTGGKQLFLPSLDDGRVRIRITADPGIPLDEMDAMVTRLESLFLEKPEVETVFSVIGGRIFGRTQRETANKSDVRVQLVPATDRTISNHKWVLRMQKEIGELRLAGLKVRMRTGRIRGVRVSSGDDEIALRIVGPDVPTMEAIGKEIARRLQEISGLHNIIHSAEEQRDELALEIDRERLAGFGLTVKEVARAIRLALDGEVPTTFIDRDRNIDVRVRLAKMYTDTVGELDSIPVGITPDRSGTIYLNEIASISLVSAPVEILRDNQRRVTEVTASLSADTSLTEASAEVWKALADMPLPEGYCIYDAGAVKTLQEGRNIVQWLLGLALFLVFAVMAVQYESLRNPIIILLAVPFTLIGVGGGLYAIGMPLSMPVWLGLIMLVGIVVNNAIVLVEFVEILRGRNLARREAIIEAGRVRLRPILMTTLTTVFGLLPLGLGLGQGSELLRPLAVTIISGLSFSMIVTLFLIPILYDLLGKRDRIG